MEFILKYSAKKNGPNTSINIPLFIIPDILDQVDACDALAKQFHEINGGKCEVYVLTYDQNDASASYSLSEMAQKILDQVSISADLPESYPCTILGYSFGAALMDPMYQILKQKQQSEQTPINYTLCVLDSATTEYWAEYLKKLDTVSVWDHMIGLYNYALRLTYPEMSCPPNYDVYDCFKTQSLPSVLVDLQDFYQQWIQQRNTDSQVMQQWLQHTHKINHRLQALQLKKSAPVAIPQPESHGHHHHEDISSVQNFVLLTSGTISKFKSALGLDEDNKTGLGWKTLDSNADFSTSKKLLMTSHTTLLTNPDSCKRIAKIVGEQLKKLYPSEKMAKIDNFIRSQMQQQESNSDEEDNDIAMTSKSPPSDELFTQSSDTANSDTANGESDDLDDSYTRSMLDEERSETDTENDSSSASSAYRSHRPQMLFGSTATTPLITQAVIAPAPAPAPLPPSSSSLTSTRAVAS